MINALLFKQSLFLRDKLKQKLLLLLLRLLFQLNRPSLSLPHSSPPPPLTQANAVQSFAATAASTADDDDDDDLTSGRRQANTERNTSAGAKEPLVLSCPCSIGHASDDEWGDE